MSSLTLNKVDELFTVPPLVFFSGNVCAPEVDVVFSPVGMAIFSCFCRCVGVGGYTRSLAGSLANHQVFSLRFTAIFSAR